MASRSPFSLCNRLEARAGSSHRSGTPVCSSSSAISRRFVATSKSHLQLLYALTQARQLRLGVVHFLSYPHPQPPLPRGRGVGGEGIYFPWHFLNLSPLPQ